MFIRKFLFLSIGILWLNKNKKTLFLLLDIPDESHYFVKIKGMMAGKFKVQANGLHLTGNEYNRVF